MDNWSHLKPASDIRFISLIEWCMDEQLKSWTERVMLKKILFSLLIL